MALMKCKECGHEVSDKASACPNCGCPMDDVVEAVLEENNDGKREKKKYRVWGLAVALLFLIGGGGYYAYMLYPDSDGMEMSVDEKKDSIDARNAIVEITPEFSNLLEVYDELAPFSEGYAAVRRGKKWGYINFKGEEVIPCSYDYADVFGDGLAAVKKGDEWGYINVKDSIVIPFTSDYYPSPFSEGLAGVSKDGKWGWINQKGEMVIPMSIKAEAVGRFSEGLAFVYREGYGEDSKFSFIDKNGKDVFSGKMDASFYQSGYRCSIEPNDFPSFHDGYAYVATGRNSNDETLFAKYDKNGAKHGVATLDKTPEYYKFDSSDYMYGIKKGNNIVVPAKYDLVGSEFGNLAHLSNGVFLVGLVEYGYGDEDITIHYGYVDLKGNDTFSDKLKEQCRESKDIAYQEDEYEEDTTDGIMNPEWLQGTWTINANIMGQKQLAKLVIDGKSATFYSDGEVLDRGEYRIYDGQIHFGSTYFTINEEIQSILFDDSHYFSHSSQSSTNVNVGTPAQNEESRIMARLKEINDRSKGLIDELSGMRSSGRMDPARYMYIKQTLLGNKDEQIRLARQLDDRQMVSEYQQQKQKLEQAFRMMESGY